VVAFDVNIARAASAHKSGADGGDDDAVFGQLGMQAFRESNDGELACSVGEKVRDRYFAADGCDVDDASGPTLLHGGENGERGV
jgi:hypothetical protein